MKYTSKPLLAVLMSALLLTGCSDKKFTVQGTINDGENQVLYFENMSLSGPVVLDSVKLDAEGKFSFREPATEAPEFYRLRIKDQIINLSIDSTETVTVTGNQPYMGSDYEVGGSENCEKIRELAYRNLTLHAQFEALLKNFQMLTVDVGDSLEHIIADYKEGIKKNYIFKEPNKAYAYFALFQELNTHLIFDPRKDPEDIKAFAAVATSLDVYYPGSERGQNLHNIALEGIKNNRIVEAKNNRSIDASKITETGLINIALQDNKGKVRQLTDLKGKVVLLDFHLFGMDDSPARILMLRELYNKYHDRGLEIFQVSFDSDEHFWKQKSAALPWISVRDADGTQSRWISVYNITELPEFFLINRNNTLVKRSVQMDDPEKEIQALL